MRRRELRGRPEGPGPSAREVNQALHHCTGSPCIPVPDHALASLPAPQLFGGMVIRLPHTSAVFSWANSAFCLLGQVEQPVLDAGPAGMAPSHVLAREFNGQVGAARFGRRPFRRVFAAERRSVPAAQLVVGPASQNYEQSFLAV